LVIPHHDLFYGCVTQYRENIPGQAPEVTVLRSTSHEQDDQYDQENGAKPAADVWATVIEATATEQDQQNDDNNYQVHGVFPP
jgi:hypothetical protein